MGHLTGKVAIITGASTGIGRATAKLFASEGASVVVTARRTAELDELVAEITQDGGNSAALAGNITSEELAKALVDLACERFGGLDIAFNNAGTLGPIGPATEVSRADWDAALAANLTGAFLGAKHQIPAMRERGGGSLIFTGTILGHTVGLAGMTAYGASKSGLIGLTQVLAAELGGERIRVNVLLPGGTETPMGRQAAPTPEARAFVEGLHALKRIAAPEEIARSALFLASDASSFTTGAALFADGGISISRG